MKIYTVKIEESLDRVFTIETNDHEARRCVQGSGRDIRIALANAQAQLIFKLPLVDFETHNKLRNALKATTDAFERLWKSEYDGTDIAPPEEIAKAREVLQS